MTDSANPRHVFQRFDGVVMLTRSDWHSRSRDDQKQHATRFAQFLPVIFVQPSLTEQAFVIEQTEVENVRVLHVGGAFGPEGACFLDNLIKTLGLKRHLIWIKNHDFIDYVDRMQHLFKILYADENDVALRDSAFMEDRRVDPVERLLCIVDLVIAASSGVADECVNRRGFRGALALAVVGAGCDFPFWYGTEAFKFSPRPSARPVALCRAGMSDRLDYTLIHSLIHRLPDWDFWFFGSVDDHATHWQLIFDHTNVTYHRDLEPAAVAELARSAHVGILPLRSEPSVSGSSPVIAFEYAACGVGVVAVEINALLQFPDVFRIANNAETFAEAMKAMADERASSSAVEERLRVARLQSHDHKFERLATEIKLAMSTRYFSDRRLNILFLYDDRWAHIMTVNEHLSSFARYSKNQFMFAPATVDSEDVSANAYAESWDFDSYDVIIVHYAVRLSHAWYMKRALAERLSAYSGLKMLFIQDEYDSTETARKWFDLIQFDAVFTCVPEEGREHVYPRRRFPGTEFVQTLTGYVPEDASIEQFRQPMASRILRIGYRGRELPPNYGELGHEKYRIGVDVRRMAEARGIPVDIEVASEKRIYGLDWYRFLGSARATLATESGSNVFDDSGELLTLANSLAGQPYDVVYPKYFAAHEGPVKMNQISPKVFEAIRLRTALVLFEGSYSGVVFPDTHFIPLKKDYSNTEEVFEKLEDVSFLEAMTERAYDHVIRSGRYSHLSFVRSIDRYIDSRVFGLPRSEIVFAPIARRARGSSTFEATPYRNGWEYTLNSKILGGDFQRTQMTQLMERNRRRLAEKSYPLSHPARHVEEGREPNAGDVMPGASEIVVVDGGKLATADDVDGLPSIPTADPVTLVVREPNEGPFAPGGRLTGTTRIVMRVVPPGIRRRLAGSMKAMLVQQEGQGGSSRGWGPRRIAWRMLPQAVRADIVARLKSKR